MAVLVYAGRESCFEQVRSRFGRGSTFVVVGARQSVESAAKQVRVVRCLYVLTVTAEKLEV